MRYKFRAYHKKKERLVDVLEINFEYNMVTLATETDSDEEYYWWSSTCPLEEVELMQYTGLTDKDGREIYEGDIVRQYPRSGYEHIVTNGDIGIVESSHGAYVIRNSHSGRTHFLFYSEQEVIGNIYQHKHLLKENG